ncbi:MAG: hypothetical protein ABMA64_43125 [Myxococcota bacterium]
MIALGWGAAASAEVPCEAPFTEFDLRALVGRSERALADDDLLAHQRAFAEFVDQVRCLDHQLPKDAYARLLVDEAIARYLRKAEWEPTLGSAMLLVPDLEQVPDYLLQKLPRPIPPRSTGVRVPTDSALFVDGELWAEVPMLGGEHVVQQWRDGEWRTVWLDGAVTTEVPAEWLVEKPPTIVEIEKPDPTWQPVGRGAVGLAFGLFDARQLVEEPGTYLADADHFGAASALTTRGWQPVADHGGLFWDGALPVVVPAVRTVAGQPTAEVAPTLLPRGYLGPAVVFESVSFGLGGGVFQLQKVEGGQPTTVTLPQAHAALGVRRARASFEVGVGGSPSAGHAAMRGAWIVTQPAPISWALGFDVDLGIARFTEVPLGSGTGSGASVAAGRGASVVQTGAVARFDLVWGADR